MRVRGEVFSGALRGTPLIEKYYPRLVGLVGFRPFRGTMDVKLERNVDIRPFSPKTIEHILMDGRKKINAYLAPVKLRKIPTVYGIMEIRTEQEEIIKNAKYMENAAEEKLGVKNMADIDETFCECWAIQFKNGIYGNDIIEIIASGMIKEILGLGDGDSIEVEFTEFNPGRRGA